MKRMYVLLLLVAAVACGGGGSDPVEPDPVQTTVPNVTSGVFEVTARQTFDECDQSTDWNGTYNVELDSLSFSMGTWVGKWTPTKAQAAGDGPMDQTTTRSCTVKRWSSVYITFSTPDKFSGTILYRLRLAGDCGTRTTCTTSWVITGTRQPESTP